MGFTRRNTPDKSASILVYGFNYYGTPRMVDFRMGCSSCASDRGPEDCKIQYSMLQTFWERQKEMVLQQLA